MEEQHSDSKTKSGQNAQSTVDEFVQKQTELIELEKQEEVEKIERLLDTLPRAVIDYSSYLIAIILHHRTASELK